MLGAEALTALLVGFAVVAVVSTVPYTLTALDYRQRDNGLAYLLLVSGVGVWNLMFLTQLLTREPLVQVFFLALSVVGAVLAGLGWFLFASTASSTSAVLDRRGVYAAISVLGGLDIVAAVTSPVNGLYWAPSTTAAILPRFAAIEPGVGYWLHTVFVVSLFGAGAALFAENWSDRADTSYTRAYVVAGTATMLALLASNLLVAGGVGVASIVAVGLTTNGWLQASRGRPIAWLRALAASG